MLNGDTIFFLGYSGHAYVAVEVAKANGLNILGYFDKSERKNNPYQLDYFGFEKDRKLKDIVKDALVFPAIGSNVIRKESHRILISQDVRQTVLIDPTSSVSNSSNIGKSTLINPKAIINSLVRIGKACIVNSGAIIEHECKIGDYSHIAPGAVLAGNVQIGEGCFIGANATIKQGVRIADNVTIGAGAVVLKDITQEGTWVGNPARLIVK